MNKATFNTPAVHAPVGEAMLTRRRTLGLLAAATVPPIVVVGATPAIAKAKAMTAQERFDYHLAEMRKAAEEIDPRIGEWDCTWAKSDHLKFALVITAHRVTGQYDGDGIYEGATEDWKGNRTQYQVRLMDWISDGHRMFDVRTEMDRMVLAEPVFITFIGRKIGALA